MIKYKTIVKCVHELLNLFLKQFLIEMVLLLLLIFQTIQITMRNNLRLKIKSNKLNHNKYKRTFFLFLTFLFYNSI